MRTLIDLKAELHKLEQKMEETKNNGENYQNAKMFGQMLELEEMINDFSELVEWIQKHKGDTIDKETILTKVRGEVIG